MHNAIFFYTCIGRSMVRLSLVTKMDNSSITTVQYCCVNELTLNFLFSMACDVSHVLPTFIESFIHKATHTHTHTYTFTAHESTFKHIPFFMSLVVNEIKKWHKNKNGFLFINWALVPLHQQTYIWLSWISR